METMKAVRLHAYGGPEALRYEDTPRPVPGAGEVLVRVHAAGVNPVDWKIREGLYKDELGHKLPLIPGWDFSGAVAALGPGVTGLKPGAEVYGFPDLSRDGAYAEFIAVRLDEIAPKPRSIDHIHAAAVPVAALTSWQALFDTARLDSGQRVLIHGASGGVGCAAVQLAKWRGAWVAGTASARNQDFLRDLGVDQAVDYESVLFEETLRGMDVVLDTQGGTVQERSWKTLKPGGILVSIVSAPSAEEAARRGARQAYLRVKPSATQLMEIASLVEAGLLRPYVETILPLSAARRAQELVGSGHTRGKIILRVAPGVTEAALRAEERREREPTPA